MKGASRIAAFRAAWRRTRWTLRWPRYWWTVFRWFYRIARRHGFGAIPEAK